MSQSSNERRQFNRFPLEASVRLFSGQACWNTTLLDLSMRGVLLARPENWEGQPGDRFRVEIALPNQNRLGMAITVAHVRDDQIGAHCDRIDFDSFSKLKRIVELNLGDPALLSRELEHLHYN